MARLFALLIILPTIFAAPQDLKKEASKRNGFGPFGSVGIAPNPVAVKPFDTSVPFGPRPRPAVSPCEQRNCRVASPCCEPEPEVEKITVPVQPIMAPTVVGYEYAEVTRPVETPKCDRAACVESRPCCEERVVPQPSVSSFVVPVSAVSGSNYPSYPSYNPSYYNYPYSSYYGGYGGYSNFGGYPYYGGLSGAVLTRPNANVNVPNPLIVEPEVKANRVN